MAAASTNKDRRCLVIEGNWMRLERTIVEREVKTDDFLEEIARTRAMESGIMPQGCIFMARRSDKQNRQISVYAIERPAGMQNVKFKPAKADEVKELHLSWPVTIWFARCVASSDNDQVIQDLWLTCVTRPTRDAETSTVLYQMPMPNIYDFGDGALCLGNLVVTDLRSAAARVDELIEKVLTSLWNTDLMPEFDEDMGIKSLEEWAEKSTNDPQFHKKIVYRKHKFETIRAMLDQLLEDTE